ncbi:carboxypeptidase-like regulatory domain-containing protein [Winogradskyella eckloniae]|uniref:carboxypeptidase-like regulatory domain-containing protein n=1 Tax=Winogradskyella eckloniae TaxID=1089306 RepID=UPI001563F8FD|nr:carboxypeptidase-like regulatory domain-containing protein [Winogradskyella eckloniae]NRD19253.1 carboxypeptidase-like regulatory domain-containing protein [Winogradskyella eckloniae]
MKQHVTLPQKKHLTTFSFISLLILTLFVSHPTFSQTKNENNSKSITKERTIKGIVSDETDVLLGVNIVQEGTVNGTTTNEKGEFTFPKKLNVGDVLLFSYIGYETQKVEIKEDTSFITVKLTLDDVTMIGTLDTGKPYKSKRKD